MDPRMPAKKKRKQVQSRRWVFTLNNYTPEEEQAIKDGAKTEFRYVVFGREVGESGTPHLQGYIELHRRRGPRGLAASLPGLSRARLAVARGDASQNRVYCLKEDKAGFESGEPMNQGARMDLVAVKAAIDSGCSDAELWEDHFEPYVRYHKSFGVYKKLVQRERSWRTKVLLFVGNSGTQKSTLAHVLGRSGWLGNGFYKVPAPKGSGLYFDKYDGQEVVLIDEMDGNRCTPTFLNELCDEFPMSVPVHGSGNVSFCAKVIIICSNYVPKDWWRNTNVAPFMRRITWAVFRPGGISPTNRRRRYVTTLVSSSRNFVLN